MDDALPALSRLSHVPPNFVMRQAARRLQPSARALCHLREVPACHVTHGTRMLASSCECAGG